MEWTEEKLPAETPYPNSLSFLLQSRTRLRILRELRDECATVARLCDELPASRPTIQRNLQKLREKGWIIEEKTDRTYRITSAGTFALEHFVSACRKFRKIDSLLTFVMYMPDVELPPIEDLVSATIVSQDISTPHQPALFIRQALERSTDLRGFDPVLNPIYVEDVLRIREEESLELVTSPETMKMLRSEYADCFVFPEDAETDAINVSTELPECLLYRLEENVIVAAYDDQYHLQVAVRSSSNQIRAWARELHKNVASGEIR